MSKTIIDIVGLAGSGKSSVCEYLKQNYGFELYRPSDAIRRYALTQGITLNGRQDYIDCHHAMIEHDPLAIVAPVFDNNAERICLDGMRAPLPFLELQKRFGASLIYLDCPAETRLKRIQADGDRSGHRMALTLEALIQDEAPDLHNPDRHLPNMQEMARLADYTIDASLDQESVLQQVAMAVDTILAAQAKA